MPCLSCQKARKATASAIRAVASGNIPEAKSQASQAARAVADKIESLRIRAMTSSK